MELQDFEILIVDDNPENLRVLGTLLKNEGYKVRYAKDGKQALSTVSESIPDLILLDIHMPEMDGFEVCKIITAKYKKEYLPIFFISALGDSFNKQQGFEAGAVDYITKPFDAQEVKDRIKVHLRLVSSINEIKELKEQLAQKEEEIKLLRGN